MVLLAIKYSRGSLDILDQKQLPHQEVYLPVRDPQDAWQVIQSMQVRGAPAIAIVAALSLAVYLEKTHAGTTDLTGETADSCTQFIIKSLKYLVTSRPTAVNLADAARKLETLVLSAQIKSDATRFSVSQAYIDAAEKMLADDVQDNENIGRYGAEWIRKRAQDPSGKLSVLTHCNTGSLATAGYGTALGIVRRLHADNSLIRAYYTETRPYNQGSRLTGYELIHDGIPATLITDSMAASFFATKGKTENVACVVVGADRVAANGDTANKIGTYSLAILARHHGVKFVVAAPRTTIDLKTSSGEDIRIEERPPNEVTTLKGPTMGKSETGDVHIDAQDVKEISIAAMGTKAWNPAFDVTPACLIDGIVTEKGVVEKHEGASTFDFGSIFPQAAEANHNSTSRLPASNPTPSISWESALSLKADQVPSWRTWLQPDGIGQFV